MDFLEDIFDFFKAVLDFIKEYFWVILAILIIILAIYFPGALLLAWEWVVTVGMPTLGSWGGAVATFFADIGLMGTLAAVAGISFLIDPEGTAEAVGEIIESVGEAAGSVGGSLLSSALSSPVVWAVGGVALFAFLASSGSDENNVTYDEYDDNYLEGDYDEIQSS